MFVSISLRIYLSNSFQFLFRSLGGRLPVVLDRKDHLELYQRRKKDIGKRPIWLGATFSSGSFVWDNTESTPVSDGFQNWHRGQPDNWQNKEECLVMNPKVWSPGL